MQQVLENKPENDKLFIAAYLDVLLHKEYEQPDEDKRNVRNSDKGLLCGTLCAHWCRLLLTD